jgi:uncharacterized transporter YbjL
MPEKVTQTLSLLKEFLRAVPFGILLVVTLLLSGKIKFKKKEVFLYFLGSIITGWGFSSLVISWIESKFDFNISEHGERGIVALVTILGFLLLIYVVKHDIVNKYFKSKVENSTNEKTKE